MGWWDYTNIGVSVTPENEKHVKAILRYIGYGEDPDYAGDGDNTWYDGATGIVYVCQDSAKPRYGSDFDEAFEGFDERDLLYLMNALFPGTTVEVHHAEGNNTSDTWEKHVETYDPDTMTYSVSESYTDYGGGGPSGERSWDERIAMEPPKPEYVQALIDLSTADGNSELTALLLDLSEKLRDGLIVYKDDPADKRVIGEKYNEEDNVEGEEDWDEDDEDEDDEEEEDEEADDVPEFQADIITFGHYPQTESGDDRTPIDWFVLERDGSKALVISRYALDAKLYNDTYNVDKALETTWENCTLRKWLNSDFLNAAFTAEEQEAILMTQVDNSKDQGDSDCDTDGGNNTQDRVFLLSYAEGMRYFGSDDDRQCAPTDYAIDHGADIDDKYRVAGRACGWWWLRSPGSAQFEAVSVNNYGVLDYSGVRCAEVSVRPAFWINLDSGVF